MVGDGNRAASPLTTAVGDGPSRVIVKCKLQVVNEGANQMDASRMQLFYCILARAHGAEFIHTETTSSHP